MGFSVAFPSGAEAELGASRPKRNITFYGNYMDVFSPAMPRGAGLIPGSDDFPLLRSQGDSDQTRMKEAEQAEAYGLDGFEIWPVFSSAEHWIDSLDRVHFDPAFKIVPQITLVTPAYPTYESWRQAFEHYLKNYGNNPRAAHLDGKPLISSWGGGNSLKQLLRLKEELAQEGLPFTWVPALDAFSSPQPVFDSLDGINNWHTHRFLESLQAEQRNALKVQRPFHVFGSFRAGYDNGNRMFTADVNPFLGLKTLLASLDAGLAAGITTEVLVTWNDAQETASLPSWLSPYGYQEIVRYYRSLYAGEPPANQGDEVVVAYGSELLLGDEFEVQFVLLPGRAPTHVPWTGKLEVEDEQGKLLSTTPLSLSADAPGKPRLFSFKPTPPLADNPPAALSLIVTGPDGVRRRLEPVNVRAGRLRTVRPFVVALDRVAPPKDLSFTFAPLVLPGVPVEPVKADYQLETSSPVSQLQIMDGLVALEDVRSAAPKSPRYYVGIDSWGFKKPIQVNLTGPAQMDWCWRLSDVPPQIFASPGSEATGAARKITIPVDAAKMMGPRRDTPVAVLAFSTTALQGAGIQIASSETAGSPSVKIPLLQLFKQDVILRGKENDTSLRVRIMEDGHVLNLDPKLNSTTVAGSAILPAIQYNEPYRILSLAGQTEDGNVFFSPPRLWVRVPAGERGKSAQIQVVKSGNSLDDHLDETVEINKNQQGLEIPRVVMTPSPKENFTGEQVRTLSLPDWRLASIDLPLKAGIGWLVGCSDSYTSLGWGWRSGAMDRTASKWLGPDAQASQWVWDGALKRYVLEFRPTSRVSIRSRSGLSGSYTLGFDLKLDAGGAGKPQRLVSDDNAPAGPKAPLRLQINESGSLEAYRNVSGVDGYTVTTPAPLSIGVWHHVDVLYDLTHFSIVVDGKAAASVDVRPDLMRSHSVPFLGASSEKAADGFAGRMANFLWKSGCDNASASQGR